MEYAEFFTQATGYAPYPYQIRLDAAGLASSLVSVPTGAGKTEAATLPWLYRKVAHTDQAARQGTTTRLVYCLPMRTLVEQTASRAERWLANLGVADDVGVAILMGGRPRDQWHLYPEKPYLIIGTQDMLLSRALNRGYGNSPFAWPVEYGLLNNDAFWVIDEVQLMANGLSTTTQLAGLRRKLETFGPAGTMWMSATAKAEWLETVDHPAPTPEGIVQLGISDLANPALSKRYHAQKTLRELLTVAKGNYIRNVASAINERHQPGTLTLVIVNTVAQAQQIYQALTGRRQVLPDAEKTLIHSRFREGERQERQANLTATHTGGRIVIATQAVEAGVDISARTLITELAPWASLTQRFGRCNRAGEFEQADVFWIDVGNDASPYQIQEIQAARDIAKSMEGQSVSPANIADRGDYAAANSGNAILRRRDIQGLFDTTPDLSGSYLDVSQFVRGEDGREVSVFWRILPDGNRPEPDTPQPGKTEMVRVPLYGKDGIIEYLKRGDRKAWARDFLNDHWREVTGRDLFPGQVLLLDASEGGYTPEIGWSAGSASHVPTVDNETESTPEDGQNSDPWSTGRRKWVTLPDHSRNVEAEVAKVLYSMPGVITDDRIEKAVMTAALHHDAGKAHPEFQAMMRDRLPEVCTDPGDQVLMAKSPGHGRNKRPHFRHEIGSALAILQHAEELPDQYRDLSAYLAAAHHGKVRLGIRSLPSSRRNPEPQYLLGHSVSEPETLPPVDLGKGYSLAETCLDLAIARIGVDHAGRRSWQERCLALLEWLGPFRLAYLEAIIRTADMRASKQENCDHPADHHDDAPQPALIDATQPQPAAVAGNSQLRLL